MWNVADAWTLKGGVSTGYKAPSLTEMEGDWFKRAVMVVAMCMETQI
ncbi:hypothetical protein JCM19239_5100 [Vibrio variabilis]|uniref:Uncharacterized protein n=1 Tax=Vibrio variabilis TaxID=990271 RepID=A0ABQ0J8V1_9VIBR|nr:hypothetical protein JCM19239_5100 [Vibrio variabilis]